MNYELSILVAALALVGCAGGAPEAPVEPDDGAPDATGSDPSPSAAGELPAMVALAMPFEVLGAPDADLTACLQFYMPVSAEGAGHAPAFSVLPAGSDCVRQHDGMMFMRLPAEVHGMLSLTGSGMWRFHVQTTTSDEPRAMKPVRLLNDAAIAAVYGRMEMAASAMPHTAVVETPADGATLTLRTNGERDATPTYLDAEGRVTDRSSSVAGGWAVFADLRQGVHEVTMSHAELRCAPDALSSWGAAREDAIALVTAREPGMLPLVTTSIAHSSAFDCR